MNYAYARVSAKDQNLQRQIAALDNLVIKVFVDDGYATVHIKLGNATEVADIRLKEVKIALEHLLTSVQTQSPLAQRMAYRQTRNWAPKNRNRRDFWEEEKPRRKRAADKVRREKPAEGDDEVPSAERRGFYPSREPTRGKANCDMPTDERVWFNSTLLHQKRDSVKTMSLFWV